MQVNLHQLMPEFYKGISETNSVLSIEESMIGQYFDRITQSINDTFILTASEAVIAQFETLLQIKRSSGDSLEFRRQRVLYRFSLRPPFTLKFLQQKLDEIIGVGKWETFVDYNNYTLYVYSSAQNQQWFEEVRISVNKIKPANIVFVNSPRITTGLNVSESVSYRTVNYNHKLGVSWNLGAKPFSSVLSEEEIKLATTPSVQNELLNDIASFTASDISKVRINGSYVITTFTTKEAENNVVTVEYSVAVSSGLSSITKVELLDSNNNVLTESNVYVPILLDIQMQHKITTVEGGVTNGL